MNKMYFSQIKEELSTEMHHIQKVTVNKCHQDETWYNRCHLSGLALIVILPNLHTCTILASVHTKQNRRVQITKKACANKMHLAPDQTAFRGDIQYICFLQQNKFEPRYVISNNVAF